MDIKNWGLRVNFHFFFDFFKERYLEEKKKMNPYFLLSDRKIKFERKLNFISSEFKFRPAY